jgi:hypothetical protein
MPFGSFVMKQVLNSGQVTDTTSEHTATTTAALSSQHTPQPGPVHHINPCCCRCCSQRQCIHAPSTCRAAERLTCTGRSAQHINPCSCCCSQHQCIHASLLLLQQILVGIQDKRDPLNLCIQPRSCIHQACQPDHTAAHHAANNDALSQGSGTASIHDNASTNPVSRITMHCIAAHIAAGEGRSAHNNSLNVTPKDVLNSLLPNMQMHGSHQSTLLQDLAAEKAVVHLAVNNDALRRRPALGGPPYCQQIHV